MKATIYLFFIILISKSAIAFTVPSFKGNLSNLSSYANHDIKITVMLECKTKFWAQGCGGDLKEAIISNDGSFIVPKLSHSKYRAYHISSYEISFFNPELNKTFNYYKSFICEPSEGSFDKCSSQKLIRELSNITLLSFPSFVLNPSVSDGRNVNWFVENRTSSKRLFYSYDLLYDGKRLNLLTQNLYVNSFPHTVNTRPVVIPGSYSNKDFKAHFTVKNHTYSMFSKEFLISPMEVPPRSITNPILLVDSSKYHLNGKFELRFNPANNRGLYFYEGNFSCDHNGELSGEFIPTTGSAGRPHPYKGINLLITGTCQENQGSLIFEINGREVKSTIPSLIENDGEAYFTDSGEKMGILTVWKR